MTEPQPADVPPVLDLGNLTALLADEGSLRVDPPTRLAPPAPGPGTVHRVPPEGRGVMSCCGRTPFEVPWYDRFAAPGMSVTCRGATTGSVE